MTHSTEHIAVSNLKPERWGSPLVQQKYQGERPVTRDNTIIIITNALLCRYATEKRTGNFANGDELQDYYKFRTREK
jgi:hypothetical protein